jgi:ribosomal-protein-alanine N-acetyltransferase
MKVRGPTLALRLPVAEDAPALFALAADEEVTRFFSWRYTSVDDARAWIETLPARRAAGTALELVIDRDGEGPVGVIALHEPVIRDRRAVIGTWLGRAQWGTGVNTEAKALAVALAFGPLGFERLGAYASPDNPRSQHALERIGFQREGLLRDYHRHGDVVHDVAVFGLLRRDWPSTPLHPVPVQFEGEPPDAWVVSGGPS